MARQKVLCSGIIQLSTDFLWMKEEYGFCKNNVFLQKTPYSFDVSVWELFLWFFCGAKLCLLRSGYEGNVETLVDTINRYGVTSCHFVPSMLGGFLEFLSHVSRLLTTKFFKMMRLSIIFVQ